MKIKCLVDTITNTIFKVLHLCLSRYSLHIDRQSFLGEFFSKFQLNMGQGILSAFLQCDSESHFYSNAGQPPQNHKVTNGQISNINLKQFYSFDFQVPQHFLHVVQLALREFFNSIQVGKDSEASWKKQIYKVIRHTDQECIPEKMLTPEFFRSLE